MSESEVSQIRDEDVLRRMWQQTEDFGRKKEIRAHMYKLREERLRDLYSPEPAHQGKGCDFSAAHAQGHGQSFADQTFQSMKSKEVRDASSPPKEFSYRGQDLKELSNAGWNVESEDRTADDGRTHVKFVNANIEGRYDVEGGQGQFAAVDRQRRAVTEHQDANSSLRRDETSSDTAAHDHVVRQTDDGTRISSTTSSSNTSSKFQQVSSTTHEVPLTDDYDLRRTHDTNRNERVTRITNNDYEQNLRTNDTSTLRKNDSSTAELVSRKVEYPDDNTKVIVETRLLPDGTRVTSTRREFRVPAQSSRSEHQSSQSKSYSSQHTSDYRDSTSTSRHTKNRSNDIVDSQRNVDDNDFKRQLREYTSNDNDDDSTQQHHVTRTNKKVTDDSQTNDEFSQKRYETRLNSKVTDQHETTTNRNDNTQTQRRIVDRDQSTTNRDEYIQTQYLNVDLDKSTTNRYDDSQTQHRIVNRDQLTANEDDHTQIQQRIVDRRNEYQIDNIDHHHTTTTRENDIQQKVIKKTKHVNDNISRVNKDSEEIVHRASRDRTVSDNKGRDITISKNIPADKKHGVPKTSSPATEEIRDIPRDRTVPVDDGYNVSRKETVPVERFPDDPRDGIAPEDRPRDISTHRTAINEKNHSIRKETKVEEVNERKTSSDHYQTTYQNDFQSRKVSTDWSPTHQAWASTLRSDTPSTTRPSTRASSPGSKTFKSSTSSLRSSVSPDKSYRKPLSRGGSPNKIDRSSPTRTITSDRYSTTRSTHSVTEEKINKNTSPERKPPIGRSPARTNYSPDRKPQDSYRQRPSASPEKKPKSGSDKPNLSPERKPADGRPRTISPSGKKESPKSPMRQTQSPERNLSSLPRDQNNPSDTYPQTSPYRSTSSPERKPFDHMDRSSPRSSQSPDRPGNKKSTDSVTPDHPKTSTSTLPSTTEALRKSSPSPDRKPSSREPLAKPKQQPDKPTTDDQYLPAKRPSTSPDRKPNYSRPTVSSYPDEKTRKPSKPENNPDRKSPSKQAPSQTSDIFDKVSKSKEDHYRFVDEETKVYTHTDRTQVVDDKVTKSSATDDSRPRDKSSPSVSHAPGKDSPDYSKVPKPRESPFNKGKSPAKDTIVITENDELYGRSDETVKTVNITSKLDKQTDENTTTKRINKNKEHPDLKDAPSRETSPSKYGTYDKKKPREVVDTTIVTTITSEDIKDVKQDSLPRRDKTSPKKVPDVPTFSKKSPRDSVSPLKSPTKDTKYKHTTDFITTERTVEEVNKKTTTKDHPRQLVTPSSSPTRKPKPTETEPSTGQSSPTTSVSGFVYFGSPRTERPVVTDLDEFYPNSENPEETTKRPESLHVQQSPSPSKIPCRSPSPEKHAPTTKDSLPRKSSLKKPSTEFNQGSPIEKPPTSFRVSPTDDKPDVLGHKVVKKDQPSEPETGELVNVEPKSSEKQKPPLQRRETYDDRCKKILGLVDDTTTESIIKDTKKYTRKSDSTQNSPSVSPCGSPAPNESSPFSNYPAGKKTTNVDVVDFITHEREEFTKNTITRDQKKPKTPSRDSSPKKVQDIIPKTTTATDKETRNNVEKDTVPKTVTRKYTSPRESPEKAIPQDSTQNLTNESQEKKRNPSPTRPMENLSTRSRLSPERKPVDKYPKKISTDTPSYNKTTTISTSDTSTTLDDDVKKTTVTSHTTRVLESPTRDSPSSTVENSSEQRQPRTISPSKQQPKDVSPMKKTLSPERKIKHDLPSHHSEPKDVVPCDSRPRKTTEITPGYMKSTTAIMSKFDSHYNVEDVDETFVTKTQEPREPQTKSSSPTRQTARPQSPTKPSLPSDSYPKRPETSPQRKPTQGTPSKQTDARQELPGYMKTTKTATTKFEKTAGSEDVQETVKSSKTTVDKKHITSGSVSPTRKPIQPKLPSERTPSPTKPSRPSQITIDKKSGTSQPSSPVKESPLKKPEPKHTTTPSSKPSPQKVPSYMKTTASMTIKQGHDTSECDVTTTEDFQEKITSTITENEYLRNSESPSRHTPKSTSPSRRSNNDGPKRHDSPERKPGYPSKESPMGKPGHPKGTSPTRGETPGYMKTTTATASKIETSSTTDNIEENTYFKNVHQKYTSEISSPESPVSSFPDNKYSKHTPGRNSASPERPSYTKPTASITSKHERTITTHDTQDTSEPKRSSPKKSISPSRQSPEREPKETSSYASKPEEPRQLRTPSPTKKTTTITETNIDFIISEREQEILNKVQKSLRKLSPERKEKSPSRERSPSKTTTSLQDLDITTSETIQTDKPTNENLTEIVEEQITVHSKVPRPTQLKDDKPKEQKISSKPTSRNVSPIKRAPSTPTSQKADKTPESPTKARSFSPKKAVYHVDRPQSPQQPKTSGIKPRETIPPHLTRKQTPATLSTTRIERITTDVKKINSVTKQNISTKSSLSKSTNRSIPSPTGKLNEPDTKRTPTPKKDNASPKKDVVTRTASDTAMKPKKTSSPQRMKSKPEIQVSDMSTKSPKGQKPIIKEPHSKLPSKPKSATSLNTSFDEDDIIIDVQQSKSSRENSPDRICPTPINFADDVGIPRFPDEVSEPDDELVKRNHHTIHETESVVDDIVEICEDEELFVKKSDKEVISERDDSLLSVNDKVNRFTKKIHSPKKPKDTTTTFKDTEKRYHSDFIDENLKSDECLLTVSEKVNKFAKGPKETKDSHSPSRKITDEYDKDTVYTDDYTKLSVNDKAHLFVETAENIKTTKVKPASKVERPDFSHVDDSLKSDDCLLSVSDKVNKFVKTAEQYITETQEVDQSEIKIKQQQNNVTKSNVDDDDEDIYSTNTTAYSHETHTINDKPTDRPKDNLKLIKEPKPSQPKIKDYGSPNTKPVDKTPAVKITTLRSSEAVKKAKALFENIASSQKTTQKDTTISNKTTKLTDIGVIKKSAKTDSTTVLHPSVENVSPQVTDVDSEVDVVLYVDHPTSVTLTKPQYSQVEEKLRSSPNRLTAQSPEVPRSKSPMRQSVERITTKTVTSRYPASTRAESPRHRPQSPKPRTESPRHRTESPRLRTESPRQRLDSDKPDKVPGYLRPTKTSQIKEETKVEETEVSSRRGSGKFGVELRRTSVERSTISSERRRSVEHHQPCIEDIFDLDLLEQMLEKVTGYEQRRRIRAQIRVAKNQSENVFETSSYTRTTKQTTTAPKSRSPERATKTAPQKTSSPERNNKSTPQKTIPERTQPKEPTMNGHAKEPTRATTVTRQRPQSPEKPVQKSTLAPRTLVRQPSPDKRRTTSPSKAAPKPKGNRFNEYASAYMKKVGLNETDKVKFSDTKTKKTTDSKQTVKHERQQQTIQEFTTTKTFTERTSSKDVIEIVQTNGKRSLSPEQRQSPERKVQFPDNQKHVFERTTQSPERKTYSPERKAHSPERRTYSPERNAQSPERRTYSPEQKVQKQKAQSPDRKAYSPERKAHSPERLHQRTPSPDFKRPKAETGKETIIKTVYDIEKKIPSKPVQEEKPSWVTNRNLKKITSESRTFSSKKIENEKPKYRAPSPSKVIAKPIDVITSSYGPGPLDANGKPLFGIKALRNGGSNFQVKGTVIRQEFHSRNGGEPEGTVSVTAYSSQPEELEQLLTAQGAEPPSRIHGLAAITTTKKFGGDTGHTLSNVHTKEDRASLEQFTHHERRVEHLDRSYDSRTHEFSGETSVEEITGHTREADNTTIEDITEHTSRIKSKKESHQDRTDRRRKEEKVTEIKRQKVEDKREKMERREDKKTVRQSSVKSLTEKYIKSANESGKSDRSAYPKAGLILRTTTMRDSVSSDDAHPAGVTRSDSEHSLCSADDTVVTTTTERTGDGIRTTTTKTTHRHHPTVTTHTRGAAVVTHHEPVVTTKKTIIGQEPVITTRKTMVVTQEPVVTTKRTTVISQEPVLHRVTQGRQGSTVTTERSFLDSSTKVTGVQDILSRMKNADIVIEEGDSAEDSEARALLNKFLGATVLMAGMQGYVADQPDGKLTVHQETVRSSSGQTSSRAQDIDLDQCWDERLLKKLLDECTDYEQRRRLRARIRTLMAEQEACASAVTEALGACGAREADGGDGAEAREEEEVTVTSSVRRDSSDKTVSSSSTTIKTSKVMEMSRAAPKAVSPFAKFRQLEKQNSTNSPNSPKTPQSPGSPSQPYFKFTDPALQCSALTIKERLLQWCRDKTRDYENVKLENFSTSWADGLAFCALVHHFLPTAFDYSKLTADRRRQNFTLAFKVADEKAGIYPLLDVDDMVAMRKPDWKCVFTYVQAIYRRFKDEP